MIIREIRAITGLSQAAFAEWLQIPQRSIENWESGKRTPPPYVVELIEYKVRREMEDSRKD